MSLVLCGEPINFEVVNELRNNAFIKTFNQYGPTECTVGKVPAKAINGDIPVQNIGKPYPGKTTLHPDCRGSSVRLAVLVSCTQWEGLANGYLESYGFDSRKVYATIPMLLMLTN
ncbi:hypothetical protein KCP76_26475 (plasmid) [Salmonella enterica subsp. enterica serovar Weltevreden]|nr:hypothetical protein KCP76_26475 [Salmonella enterica subsp. enterica serovar Weltevreden]